MNLQELVELRLTPDEAICYSLLINKGMLTPKEIADEMGKLPAAVYRLTQNLEGKGFIIISAIIPTYYKAISPEIAIEAYVNKQHKRLEELKIQSIQKLSNITNKFLPTTVDLLHNNEAINKEVMRLIHQSKKEVLVILDEAQISNEAEELYLSVVKRKVTMKLLINAYNYENEQLLKKWVKMSMEVRFRSEISCRLIISDAEKSILFVDNTDIKGNITGINIKIKGLTVAFRTFFYSQWDSAFEVAV